MHICPNAGVSEIRELIRKHDTVLWNARQYLKSRAREVIVFGKQQARDLIGLSSPG